jgi:F0F1-type ATP synthase membrane subunit b/b'
MFVVRTFKSGRTLEAALENTLEQMRQPKPEQPNPEMMKAQAQQQADQMRLQHEQGIEQARQQLESAKLQAQQQVEQIKLQAQAQIEQFKAENAKEIELMKQQAETERQAYKAQLDAQTRLQIAEMQTQAQQKPAAVLQIDAQDKLNGIADIISQAGAAHGAGIAEAVNQLGTVAQVLLGTAEEMKKPKKRVIQRDQNGKAIAAIEVSE